MKRHLTLLLTTILALGLVAQQACAQGGRGMDRVHYRLGSGAVRLKTGTVLSETWKGLKLDTNGDGRANNSFKPNTVVSVEYGKRLPRYMLDARLLKKKDPEAYIRKLSLAYDNSQKAPKFIRQHAYYNIAITTAKLARRDPRRLSDAVKAYKKLLTDIPDTRYAVKARLELGDLLLGMGKGVEAVEQYRHLTGGTYGREVALRSKLKMARVELSLKNYTKAERLLRELAPAMKDAGPEILQELKLMEARSCIGQKKLAEADKKVRAVLDENPSPRMLGAAYGVLGDCLAEQDETETALVAYLKVLIMYGDKVDVADKARAGRQAARMFLRLGRSADAERLKKRFGG